MTIVRLDTGSGDAASEETKTQYVEDLRLRSAESLERAYGFLRARDDDWAKLRAEVLCEGRPAADLGSALVEAQRADGGFPIGTFVSGGAIGFPQIPLSDLESHEVGIVGALEAFLQASDAKILHGEWVERGARFFESVQDPDGSFRVPTLPSDDLDDRAAIFWTGMVGGILGRTPVSRRSLLESAGVYLADRFEPAAIEHEGFPLLLAYSHFFTNVAHDLADEALQWCGRALEKGFRSRQLDAVSTVRVLLTCDAQAMPGATFDVAELLSGVLEEQAGDGGFAELSVGGPESRTTPTFDAMLAIVRLCAAFED